MPLATHKRENDIMLFSANGKSIRFKESDVRAVGRTAIGVRGMKLKKSSPLKLLSQFQPNFAEMILRWSPFKFVSVSAVLYPRWPPLLKCIISQNRQKFKVHKKIP
jgi:DNA gyrase/topoisomerase IV subunit A